MAGLSDWRDRASGGSWRRGAQALRNQGGVGGSQSRRGPQQIRQTIGGVRSAGPQSWEAQQSYYNDPGIQQAREWWRSNVPIGQRGDYEGFMGSYLQNPGSLPGAPAAPAGPGGPGGGGYGGGGGGGGAPAMTQAMFDAMLQALGTRGPQLTLNQVDLPGFRGQNLPAFNPSPYNTLSRNLATATSRDLNAITRGANQTTAALGAYSANPYAAAAAVPPPPAQAQGTALQATAGGAPGGAADANAAAAQAASANAGAETGAFNDLLKVLGANYGQAQNSRLAQVAMDAQSARNQVGAQNLGLGAQIGMARTQAYDQWRQQDAERRYQNSLMAQQWQREEMQRNQDIANQQAQGRWQQGNEMIANRLTPLLQLIQGTAGANINMGALQQMLAGWSR